MPQGGLCAVNGVVALYSVTTDSSWGRGKKPPIGNFQALFPRPLGGLAWIRYTKGTLPTCLSIRLREKFSSKIFHAKGRFCEALARALRSHGAYALFVTVRRMYMRAHAHYVIYFIIKIGSCQYNRPLNVDFVRGARYFLIWRFFAQKPQK